MKASTKRIGSLLVSLILILSALFIFIRLVKPQYEAAQKLSAELSVKTKIYNDESQAIAQVQNLILQSKNASREILSLALPSKEKVADIMNQLQAITQGSDMSMQSFSLDYLPVRSDKSQSSFIKNIGTLRLRVGLIGSYEALKKTVESLETNVRVMDVQLIKSGSVGKSPNLFLYDLTVDTYYQTD